MIKGPSVRPSARPSVRFVDCAQFLCSRHIDTHSPIFGLSNTSLVRESRAEPLPCHCHCHCHRLDGADCRADAPRRVRVGAPVQRCHVCRTICCVHATGQVKSVHVFSNEIFWCLLEHIQYEVQRPRTLHLTRAIIT